MQDRNPSLLSKICPKCKAKAFRLSIGTMFVRIYGCYCKNCGYTTEPSVSQLEGCKEWYSASSD